MSRYHKECIGQKKDPEPNPPAHTSLGGSSAKPLCDCEECKCKDCPNILKRLAIKVANDSYDFGNKTLEPSNTSPEQRMDWTSSLMDVVRQNRDCPCEIVARAVRSHVHMYLGLSEQRAINDDLNPLAALQPPTQGSQDKSKENITDDIKLQQTLNDIARPIETSPGSTKPKETHFDKIKTEETQPDKMTPKEVQLDKKTPNESPDDTKPRQNSLENKERTRTDTTQPK